MSKYLSFPRQKVVHLFLFRFCAWAHGLDSRTLVFSVDERKCEAVASFF